MLFPGIGMKEQILENPTLVCTEQEQVNGDTEIHWELGHTQGDTWGTWRYMGNLENLGRYMGNPEIQGHLEISREIHGEPGDTGAPGDTYGHTWGNLEIQGGLKIHE